MRRINDSTLRGEFNNLGGRELLKEHRVLQGRQTSVSNLHGRDRGTTKASRGHRPGLVSGGQDGVAREKRHTGSDITQCLRRPLSARCCGLVPYMSERYK